MKGFLLAIAVLPALLLTGRADACSMAAPLHPSDPRALLADAEGAFLGTLVSVTPKEPGMPLSDYELTYVVEERVRGDVPDRIVLTRPAGISSCEPTRTIGRRAAYLLHRVPTGPWLEEVSEEVLRRGLLPYPELHTYGTPAFVAGGHFGTFRTAVLDERGRALAYGAGRGAVTAVSVCAGGGAMVELVRRGESVFLASRRLPGLELIRERRLVRSGFGDRVDCRNRAGSVALASVRLYGKEPDMRLLRTTPASLRTLERDADLSVAVHGDQVFVSRENGRLTVRDLRTGARHRVALTGKQLRDLSVSPDGSRLVGSTFQGLVLVDVATGRVKTIVRGWSPRSRATWLGQSRIVVSFFNTLETFDGSLRPLGEARKWTAHTTAVTAAGPFGVDWNGAFLTDRGGGVVRVGQLFSPAVSILEPLR